MTWTPVTEEERAYYSVPKPAPALISELLHRPEPAGDPTWGRAPLPRAPDEARIRATHGHRDGKVWLDEHTKDEWVAYQVWEPTKGSQDRECDLVFCHGINDYGGKFAVHADHFLDAGYRVVVPDLPGHGRSTGIHVYTPRMEALADAVYAVIKDVALQDSRLVQEQEGSYTQTRKVFVAGQSLGGFTATLTCLKYGAPVDTSLPSASHASFRPTISGGIFLCPMLAISPESRPAYAVELAARALASIAGPLPFASANKGKNSEDPSVEEQFDQDPQTYSGKLRIATGLAVLQVRNRISSVHRPVSKRFRSPGHKLTRLTFALFERNVRVQAITEINDKLSHLRVPFLLCHGTGDRVTSYHGSERLLREAESTDKELKLYPDYQHILLRKGKDAADDMRRQTVLNDMLEWLDRH
ncbi:hypothetical protein C6P46_003969 [Rhodotorula mucilaginosa]|uniref:Serine aminopeptidase S33 domain-containing protein n=1 Tax=Rhodotorula mucilaginosa TaxID=5537 RepID=A0A9P6W3K4_RHOMI|nr:hypothetical protein C6P46_003969 [Rhodotorula mucilaginosa]